MNQLADVEDGVSLAEISDQLKRLQQQMTYLEKKMDKLLEGPSREHHVKRRFGGDQRPRGRFRDDRDHRGSGDSRDRRESFFSKSSRDEPRSGGFKGKRKKSFRSKKTFK